MDIDLEIKIWADLEYRLGREPLDSEFENAINRTLLNLPYEHDQWLEEVATGN